MLSASQTILNWCVLVIAVSLLGHLVHRFTGYPRMLGYTLVGLVGGWLGFGDLLGEAAARQYFAAAGGRGGREPAAGCLTVVLFWSLRQPWLTLQSG